MIRSLKIFSVLLLTFGLLTLMGGSSVLMASHNAHFVSERGPRLPQGKDGCEICHAPGIEQCKTESNPLGAPVFADGTPEVPRFLADTTVCDPCHSKDGNYDGVVVMAKENWDDGVYNEAGDALKEDMQDWCATCHDDGTCVIYGVSAPNVMGDSGENYGYKMSGHGRPSAGLKCEDCHDLALSHIDGLQRTYSASSSPNNYKAGYRLVKNMIVPRTDETHTNENGAFDLCTDSCHDYDKLTGSASGFRGAFISNRCGPVHNYHEYHFDTNHPQVCGDSDFDGTPDSHQTCILCHNVHGSPMEFDTGTSNIVIDDFEAYTDRYDLCATWTRGWDASWAYLASGYGPDGSNCMAMKVTWDLDPAGVGYEVRDLAPIDLTHMDYISFYVNVYYVPAFSGIKVALRRSEDGIWVEAAYSTSELGLQSGVWKLVSFPKTGFDLPFGEVNEVALIAYENNPSISFATWILFDDIRYAVRTTDYHPNPVMIRHGELISTPGTTDKVPAFDFKYYQGNCNTFTPPGGPPGTGIVGSQTTDYDESLWGTMVCGGTGADFLSYNKVCFGCHAYYQLGPIQYYREPLVEP